MFRLGTEVGLVITDLGLEGPMTVCVADSFHVIFRASSSWEFGELSVWLSASQRWFPWPTLDALVGSGVDIEDVFNVAMQSAETECSGILGEK